MSIWGWTSKPISSAWEADAGQLQQLIMNLVIDAAEAIPDGQPGGIFVRTGLQVVDGRSRRIQAWRPKTRNLDATWA